MKRLRRLAQLALLPLSVVPIAVVAPTVLASHERFVRVHDTGPLAAPIVGLTAAERARFTPLPATPGQIPVLVWHGIDPANDGYSISQRAFARELALLSHLGYHAISMRQWAAFRAGHAAGLPSKPILLTFDDGRLDSYRGADRVLQRYGMRAAMFVITGEIERKSPFYLSWAELHRMVDSGRWDVEPHAHQGHVQIPAAPTGNRLPFYAARRLTTSDGVESLADWEARVTGDLLELRHQLEQQGLEPHAFAVPFGDLGQRAADDERIPELLGSFLTRQFGSYLVQSDDGDADFTTPGQGAAERYELRTQTTLDELDGWLRRHAEPAGAAPTTPETKR